MWEDHLLVPPLFVTPPVPSEPTWAQEEDRECCHYKPSDDTTYPTLPRKKKKKKRFLHCKMEDVFCGHHVFICIIFFCLMKVLPLDLWTVSL